MATFEEWQNAKKRLNEARKQVGSIHATLSKKAAEMLPLWRAKLGAPPTVAPAAVALEPGLQILPWPTEKQIEEAINELRGALAGENQIFSSLDAETKNQIKRE